MSQISVTVEFLGGTSVREAAIEMQSLADRIGIDVQGRFNDVLLCASPGGDAAALEAGFNDVTARKAKIRVAFSARRKLGRERDQ